MRQKFQQFIRYSDEQFSYLWKNAIFVFDTNVLLDFYRYSFSTRDNLIETLISINGRLWIPHQVGQEFFRNRPGVIIEQTNLIENLIRSLEGLKKTFGEKLEEVLKFRSHPIIEKTEIIKSLNNAIDENIGKLSKAQTEYPDFLRVDPISEKIFHLFGDKVGDPYEITECEKIFTEGKDRYSRRIPPGFMDANGSNKKEGNDIFSDLLIWHQIMDKAKQEEKPIIFITNDQKEDWWWIEHGQTIGPRHELIEEFISSTNKLFYMYTVERFLEYSKEYLKSQINQTSLDEVKYLSDRKEKLLQEQKKTLVSLQQKSKMLSEYFKEVNSSPHLPMFISEKYLKSNGIAYDTLQEYVKDIMCGSGIGQRIFREILDKYGSIDEYLTHANQGLLQSLAYKKAMDSFGNEEQSEEKVDEDENPGENNDEPKG